MSRILSLIALALAAAAVAASVAGADNGVKVDPLAVSYLAGQGLTPSEITSWTTGDCSGRRKNASCYAMLDQTASPVDPLAVSYLAGQGLTSSEITSWTTGDCSGQNKDTSCYAMLESSSTEITSSSGFSWGDAGIGAAATLGIVFLIGALGAALVTRRNRHDPFAPA